MLFTPAALLSLPLLATAAPAGLTFQQYAGSDIPSSEVVNKLDIDQSWGIDLDELRLVQFGADEAPIWMSEADKIRAKADGKRFMDITETPTLGISTYFLPSAVTTRYAYPSPGNHTTYINHIYKSFSIDAMKAFLTKFTSFRTRYYRSDTGKQSQKWLLSQIQDIAKGHKGISVGEFEHSWGQNSIIVRFAPAKKGEGKDVKDKDDGPVTVIGAHQDSANQWIFFPAPGADDDGSGTTSSLTALRALAEAKYTPETPVEFHYFSAEEGGLLGSQAVAKAYEDKGIKVKAMLQMDMTAWVKAGTTESVGIIQDFVDPDLTGFLEELVGEYLSIPAVKTKCGYACSDHSSFSKAGYQSSFAIESTFEDSNHNIHTSDDTMNHPEFSFTHMREFSKLAVAFAVELGGVVEA